MESLTPISHPARGGAIKTKVLSSLMVSVQLICAFFSHMQNALIYNCVQ